VTAFTFLRARATRLGLAEDFLSKIDVHVHLPEGGQQRDGASLGLPVLTALASLLTRLKVRTDVASSGELTLRGSVLPVPGIKEKCLAAHREGIQHVILPQRNAPDLVEVPDEILKDLTIHFISRVDELLSLVLEQDEVAPPVTTAPPT